MEASYELRRATASDADEIWILLQQAIERRRLEGSRQWQDGYPNPKVVFEDITSGYGYVLVGDGILIAYAAIMVNNEPAYDTIEGAWLTSGSDFLVLHRVAVRDGYLGRGMAVRLFVEAERLAAERRLRSIRVDTNYDNNAMLAVLRKLDYTYCGEVVLRGGIRQAFEKIMG